jgi:hypothetical protein
MELIELKSLCLLFICDADSQVVTDKLNNKPGSTAALAYSVF